MLKIKNKQTFALDSDTVDDTFPIFRYEFDKAAADQASLCHSKDYGDGSDALQRCLNSSNIVPAVENGELYCR